MDPASAVRDLAIAHVLYPLHSHSEFAERELFGNIVLNKMRLALKGARYSEDQGKDDVCFHQGLLQGLPGWIVHRATRQRP